MNRTGRPLARWLRTIPGVLGFAVALVGASARPAQAALTSSERGQIRDFFSTARVDNANKVRSLVARTDLTPEESIAALTEAVAPVSFEGTRPAFLKELVFGGASQASRPILAYATVRGLLARADGIYQRYVGGLDHEPKAIAELVTIYGFIDATIANAGKPTSTQHDGMAGIPVATYEDCSKALRDHIETNARWLKGDGAVPGTIARLRAQAQVALVDMLPDGLTRRVDAADRLGLKGARRAILTDYGILFTDAGKLDDAGATQVRQLLARLPGARNELGMVFHGEGGIPALVARGQVVHVAPVPEPYPFDEAPPGSYDPTTSAIAHDLAVVAALRALDNRWAQIRLQADRDTIGIAGDATKVVGKPRAPSVESIVGAAIHSLLVDAPKTVDLAAARALGGRPESIALVSDALGVLAAPLEGDKDPKTNAGGKVELGKPGGLTAATGLKLAPNGTVVGFKLENHTWQIDRASPSYQIMGVRRDGTTVATGQVVSKSIPRDGAQWTESGLTFVKLRGTPRVAITPPATLPGGPTVKLLGSGADAFDVVTATPPAADLVLEGDLFVRDGPGGLAFRVQGTKKGFRGGTLVVTPGGATVLSVVEDGNETNLAAPLTPSPSGPVHVRLTLAGARVEAIVGNSTLRGTLPEAFGAGDVALVAKKNASVELGGFTLRRK